MPVSGEKSNKSNKLNTSKKSKKITKSKKVKKEKKTDKELDDDYDEYQESELKYDEHEGGSDIEDGQFEDEIETDVGFEEDYSDEDVDDEDKLDDNNEVDEVEIVPDEDDCYFKYAENSDDEYFEDEEVERPEVLKELKGNERIGKPVLFYDERIRLLGDRTKQLSQSAKCMVKGTDHLPDLKKAELEIEYGVCPIIIKRNLPNGYFERWHISELKR